MAEVAEHSTDERLRAVTNAVGLEHIITDPDECDYYSQDLYRKGPTVLAVVRPPNVALLQEAVRAAAAEGLAIFPRGGGYSYTDAFLPTTPDGIVVDTSLLSGIIEINPEDMYVTVEAGCTWQGLDEALAPHGLRAEFWGPLSGFQATIGGGISQGSVSLGSAKDGASSEAVLGLEIVTANGDLLRTGSSAQEQKSDFFRGYGPDLTGLFCCDAGALGVKARVTLRLKKRAKLTQGLSFGFKDFHDFSKALQAIAAVNRATEVFGFTTRAMEAAVASPGLMEDLKIMFSVGRASGGILSGLAQMIRMALAGRRFASKAAFYAHCAVEAENSTELRGQVKCLQDAVGTFGEPMPNTMPTVMRATPFMPYPVVGSGGKRMVPLHVILPFSKASEFHDRLEELRRKWVTKSDPAGISIPAMFSTISTNAVLYEPVFYWPDKPTAFHRRHSPEAMIGPMLDQEDNDDAREIVRQMFSEMVDLMHEMGGVHLQIGKVYPWTRDRDSLNLDLVKTVKDAVDPDGVFNPGALGLI